MSPPRTRLKSNSDSSASDYAFVANRKRKNSDTDFIALINQVEGLKSVCANTYKVVEELKCVIENLLAENVCMKAELCKLQELHATMSAKSDQCYSNTVVQLKKLNSVTAATSSLSYSSVVNNPVVVIKPKDSTQASSTTKKDLRENVSPATTECNSISGSIYSMTLRINLETTML